MQALSRAGVDRFLNRLGQRLRESFPQVIARQNFDEAGITRACRCVVELAASHGVHDEHDVITFFDCAMLLGESFDRDPALPWAAAILQRGDLSGTQKMALLHDHIVFGMRS